MKKVYTSIFTITCTLFSILYIQEEKAKEEQEKAVRAALAEKERKKVSTSVYLRTLSDSYSKK